MNFASSLTPSNVAGLFELDKFGTVLYSRFREHNTLTNAMPQLIGQNFFDETARFENIEDFRQIFKAFIHSQQFADNFVFDCRFAEEVVPVRVMIMRAYQTSCAEPANIVILDIRKNVK